MCNINYLFLFWTVMSCLHLGHGNKLDTFWTPNVDCTPTQDPCTLFQDICEPHGTCVPQGCNYKCVCQGGFEGSDCLHPPSQTSASNPSPEPSSNGNGNGNGNGKRLDIIVGNGALNFLDSLLKESTTASKVIDNIKTTTAVEVTTIATSTKEPVQTQIQESLPRSQPLTATKTATTNQSVSDANKGDQVTTKPTDAPEIKTVKPSSVSISENSTSTNLEAKRVSKTTASRIIRTTEPSSVTKLSKQLESKASSDTSQTRTIETGSPNQTSYSTSGTASGPKSSTSNSANQQSKITEAPKKLTMQFTPPTKVVPNDQLQSQTAADIPKQAFTTAQTIVKENAILQPPVVMSVVPPNQDANTSTTEKNQPEVPNIAEATVTQTPEVPTSTAKVNAPVQPPPAKPAMTQESTLSLLTSLVSELKTLTESLPRTLGLKPATQPAQSETTTTQPKTSNVQSDLLDTKPATKQESPQQNTQSVAPDLTTNKPNTRNNLSEQTTQAIHTVVVPALQDSSKKPTTIKLETQSTTAKSVSNNPIQTATKSNRTLITSTASATVSLNNKPGESSTLRAEISKVLDTIDSGPTTMAPNPLPLSLSHLPVLSAFLSPNFQNGFGQLVHSKTEPVTNSKDSVDLKTSKPTTSAPEVTSQRTTTVFLTDPASKPTPVASSITNSSDGDVLISAAAVKESKSNQDDNKLDKSSKTTQTGIEDLKQNLAVKDQNLPMSTSTAAPQSLPTSFNAQPYQSAKKETQKSRDPSIPASKTSGVHPWKTGELSETKNTEDNNVEPNSVRGHMTRKGKIFKDLIWDTILALPSAPEIPESILFADVTSTPTIVSPDDIPTTSSSQFKENVITSPQIEQTKEANLNTSSVREQLNDRDVTTSSVQEQPIEPEINTSLVKEQPIDTDATTSLVQEQPIESDVNTSSAREQPNERDVITSSAREQPIERDVNTSSAREQLNERDVTTISVQEESTTSLDDDKKSSLEDQDDSNPSSTPDSKTIDSDDLTTVPNFDMDSFASETLNMTSSSSNGQ